MSYYSPSSSSNWKVPVPVMTGRAFEVNPSPGELALGQLEQWRRSKLSKAWKNVLVSLVKGRASMEDTSLCVWRNVIADNGSTALELLQQIPMREVQWVDFDTNIHPSSGSDGVGGGEMNRFALSLYQATEDIIFRARDDPTAVRDWVTTLKTVRECIKDSKASHDASGTNSFVPPSQTQTQPQAKQPQQPQVDLLDFDQQQATTPANIVHYGLHNVAQPSHPSQQLNMIYQQPQIHQAWQHQPQPQPVYPQQQPTNFGNVGPINGRSHTPQPPHQPRPHSPPPLSFHNNPYAPQPRFATKPHQPLQHTTPNLNPAVNQQQWIPSTASSGVPITTQQHRPVPMQAPPINFNNNGSNHSTGSVPVHHHRAHTPQPRAKPPGPIPRPAAATTSAPWTQAHSPQRQQQQQQQYNHQRQHNRPHRSLSAPPPKTQDNSADAQRHAAMKLQVIRDWALQPPQLQQLKPLSELIRTIPKVFPPHATYVSPHEYFQKWDTSTMFDLNNNTEKSVRKLRFFLHPDKLPKDFTQDQIFLCKILWDVVNDAQQLQEGTKR